MNLYKNLTAKLCKQDNQNIFCNRISTSVFISPVILFAHILSAFLERDWVTGWHITTLALEAKKPACFNMLEC